jgi:hypothetical protein
LNINKLTFEIRELPNGWLNQRSGYVYPTAAHALRAINAQGRKLVTKDSITLTKIIWAPSTKLGRQIIEALTAE